MAADLLSIVKQIWDFGVSIKTALEKAEHNAEDCRRIGDLLGVLGAIANSKHLRQGTTPDGGGGGGLTRDAAARLDDALGRASELVARCERKGCLARRAWKADDIAEELRGICFDVLLNMTAVLLANGVNLTAMLAEVKEDVARILQIVDARPDVHLQKVVEKLVQAYQNSTEHASPQIRNKSETKKTDVAISQSRNKRETKKTDGTISPQTKSKREAKKAEVARQEVKIQKNRSKVAPHASLQDGLADQSDSADGVVGQYGSRTFLDKAISSVPKLMDKVQSVAVSAAPFQLQQIISRSGVPGDTGSYKIRSKSSKTSKLLEVYPLKLRFPLKPNKETMRCPVTLINKTDNHAGVWIKPTNERFTKTTILEPHSTLVVSLTNEQLPQDSIKFEVLMIIVQPKQWKHNIAKLDSSIAGKLNMDSDFMACVEKLRAEVYWAMLTPSIWEPASCQIIPRSIENMTSVTSTDVHPAKTWIVTGHEGGQVYIWDYQKKEIVMELLVNEVTGEDARKIHGFFQIFKETAVPYSVCSVKFVPREELLLVGDGDGYIYVYDYAGTELKEVKKFRAHHNSVDSLAVHPTETYLLSSSAFSRNIKLWDWSRGWVKIKEFDVKPATYEDGVRSVKFNPRDTNTFACVAFDKRVKVGNIKSSSLTTVLKGPLFKADYFFTHNHQHLMVTLSFKSPNSEIRDLETEKIVHTLGVNGRETTRVACHPTLPILATMLDDGTLCLWDASTYRLEEMVHITNRKSCNLVFVTDTDGLTRLIVTFETMIAIIEVNLPIANTSKRTGSGSYG